MRCIISDKGRAALRREIHRKGGSFAVSAFPYGTPSSGKSREMEKNFKKNCEIYKKYCFFCDIWKAFKKGSILK